MCRASCVSSLVSSLRKWSSRSGPVHKVLITADRDTSASCRFKDQPGPLRDFEGQAQCIFEATSKALPGSSTYFACDLVAGRSHAIRMGLESCPGCAPAVTVSNEQVNGDVEASTCLDVVTALLEVFCSSHSSSFPISSIAVAPPASSTFPGIEDRVVCLPHMAVKVDG